MKAMIPGGLEDLLRKFKFLAHRVHVYVYKISVVWCFIFPSGRGSNSLVTLLSAIIGARDMLRIGRSSDQGHESNKRRAGSASPYGEPTSPTLFMRFGPLIRPLPVLPPNITVESSYSCSLFGEGMSP